MESLDLAINMQREQLHLLKRTRGQSAATADPDRDDIEDYLESEVECLEATLSKRRAELKEADSRLRDCRKNLQSVKEDAEQLIIQYDGTRNQLESVQQELSLLEDKKCERESDVAQLMVQSKKLAEEKEALESQASEIKDVISEKDSYFTSLAQRISQSEQVKK